MEAARAWRTATRIAIWVAAGLFVVLLVTGIALTFRYRPTITTFQGVTPVGHPARITLRNVHRLASLLLLPALVGLAAASIGLFLSRRDGRPIALPVAAVVVALVTGFTGYLLPWDQLGLWAVTVGTDMRGYTPILRGHDVKFVLIGSRELGTGTLSRWYWLHAVVLPVVLVGLLGALVWCARPRRVT